MTPGRALITGVTGQDGSYLAELLLAKGYEVHGMVRRSSTETFERIAHLRGKIQLHQADLLDQSSLVSALRAARPAEVYNLAAQSFVPTSWVQPSLTGEFTAIGVTRMLESEGSARSAVLQVYILTAAFCSISLAFAKLEGYMALLFLVVVGFFTYRLVSNLGALAIAKDRVASGELSLDSGENKR